MNRSINKTRASRLCRILRIRSWRTKTCSTCEHIDEIEEDGEAYCYFDCTTCHVDMSACSRYEKKEDKDATN